MKKTEVRGNRDEGRKKFKLKFTVLSNRGLVFAEGKEDEMYRNFNTRPGKTKEELQMMIATL